MPSGWLDIHAHFSPPGTPEQVRAVWQAMYDECFTMPEPYVWNVDRTLWHMDRTGVAMQILSQVPRVHGTPSPESVQAGITASNRYGASLVAEHPDRFGLLAALPTDDVDAAVAELCRADDLGADGYILLAPFSGVHLGAPELEPLWGELERRGNPILIHPDAHAPAAQGRPSPLVEVAFDTARSVIDMLYAGVFRRYPELLVVLGHCGGAFPALSGRITRLGTEVWVPNPNGLTREELREQTARLYVDTAASSADSLLWPAVRLVGEDHIVYGSDNGTPCTSELTVEAGIAELRESTVLRAGAAEAIGRRGFEIFPAAARRAGVTVGAGSGS
ncbi:amidohydrolase family protein [Streptomyces sp. NPDC004959]|uniref:amidohydrolase family protein n=1 Tax=unclassified Streptomyces TaxID=2593676 RepID=UPI00056C4A44|nr:amidohydrolase family protein [Streptomyces sp. NRRL F-5630]